MSVGLAVSWIVCRKRLGDRLTAGHQPLALIIGVRIPVPQPTLLTLIKMNTVLITGISRGIGKALAQKFIENGDFVIGTSTTGTLDWQNNNLTVCQLDLSKPESIKNSVIEITKLNKKIDILINNAGIAIEEEVNEPKIIPEYVTGTIPA